jgi:3-deoxy-D-manno-octulosonic-acid transferase
MLWERIPLSCLVSWLLNIVYLAVLAVSLPLFVWQAIRTGKYRAGVREKFLGLVPLRAGNAPCVWIHAVSVGEVNLVATLLGELRREHVDWEFVVSTTSLAGFELARKKYADLAVCYCPLDFSWAVRTAMRRVRPTLLMLAELELWPNLIAAAKEQGARVVVINGRLSDRSFPRYKRIRPFIGRVLRQVDLFAVQNRETADRFLALGAPPDRVHITGSLKYDGAQTDRHNPRTAALRRLAGFTDDDIIFLAGSTQEPEEQTAVEIHRKFSAEHPRLRLVLVPRHPERFDTVAAVLESSGLPWQRRSTLDSTNSVSSRDRAPSCSDGRGRRPILLVDTVGELSAWWGTATIAFVGGSFGSRGGQNMIEPAAYGAAVSFGPNTWNFRDIVASLLAADAAVVVQDTAALESFVGRCLNDSAYAAALGKRAQALVNSQLGATQRTVKLITAILDAQSAAHERHCFAA